MYSVGVIGNKEKVFQYLQTISQEVIFSETREIPKSKKLSNKVIPHGVIVLCKFYCDRCQSLSRSRRLYKRDTEDSPWNPN